MGNAWMARGSCREVDPELFFPTSGRGVNEAKRVCASCEVVTQCLEYALNENIEHGIWAARANASAVGSCALVASTCAPTGGSPPPSEPLGSARTGAGDGDRLIGRRPLAEGEEPPGHPERHELVGRPLPA